MAKSKRSKIKQANRAVAKETLREKELKRLKATCLSLHRMAGLVQSFTVSGKNRKIQHGGFESITTYVPTPDRPRKFAVHQIEDGRYVQKDPNTILGEEQQAEMLHCQYYEDTRKPTEAVSTSHQQQPSNHRHNEENEDDDNDKMAQVAYIRATDWTRRKKRGHKRFLHKNERKIRQTKHPHNKNIRRLAF
ncbi:hypothetical protein GAYE_SCF7681MG7034 [Galdieria yellowstonensis]|uniref:BZIP domain-containing protein n=1 Tax=Galdieria yellowstonensis TaxID=3028027 RepID=A0AAV9IP47_9RHOD|nr:hypothetical protein GAYE_SCF7681MG7034 [Galdieria yellowstonensis]